jgi:hypothetical protein
MVPLSTRETTLFFEYVYGFAPRDHLVALSLALSTGGYHEVMPTMFAIAPSDAERTTYEVEEAPIPLYARDCAD